MITELRFASATSLSVPLIDLSRSTFAWVARARVETVGDRLQLRVVVGQLVAQRLDLGGLVGSDLFDHEIAERVRGGRHLPRRRSADRDREQRRRRSDLRAR